MANRVVMPKLTDTMEEGVLLQWYKQEGDRVESGDPIAEVETDKAVMDLEAFASGILKKILVPKGYVVPSGDLIALIAREDERIDEILAHETLPRMRKREEKGTPEKAQVQSIAPSPPKKPSAPPPVAVSFPTPEAGLPSEEIKASPLARKIAQERGIDLRNVKGSGPRGRITQRDVEGVVAVAAPTPAELNIETGQEIELSMIRKAIAKRMVQSKAPVPHFYVTSEIDMGKITAFREEMEEGPGGVKLTLSELFLKAVGLTLRKFPAYRSTYLGDRVRIATGIDVGLAVAVPDGIITAVIRDCDRKTLTQISAEVRDKIKRAREKALKPEEYTGAIFSLSNLGMYDVESFSAIITPPESGVLAIGSILEKPVVSDGQIRIGKTVKVTLSTDHRVADGVAAAGFLKELKKTIQNPLYLAL
ncbi:MAG: dihydrolipoamide acetyltransferase family protein [Candidatus Manganitrophaceae bacterium]